MFYHMGERQQTENIHMNKVTGENKTCAFYCTEETARIFGPLSIFDFLEKEKVYLWEISTGVRIATLSLEDYKC